MPRLLAAAPRALVPLAVVAAVLGLLAPSGALARRSDLLLTALVLVTALGIPWRDLAGLRARAGVVAVLSVVPLLLLAAAAWALGRPFGAPVREGLLGCGLASAEVASVGLVALAGADAAIALGALAGSLIVSAVIGPLAIGPLGGGGAHVDAGGLVGRFALVVGLPLAAGIAVRAVPAVERVLSAERRDRERDGAGAVIVALLVYAAMSGTRGGHQLGASLLAAALFLVVAAALAGGWGRLARGRAEAAVTPGAFGIAMRDFAVAAALATQAFGTRAGTVPGIYGVLMLVAGAAAASALSD